MSHGSQINVSVNIQGLFAGNSPYTGKVTVTLTDINGGTAHGYVTVNLTISPPPPCVTLTPTLLSFNSDSADSITGNIAPQSFTVNDCGDPGTIQTIASTKNGPVWLTADSGGSIDALHPLTLNASVSTQGLFPGSYTGQVTVILTDVNGHTTEGFVTVNFTVVQVIVAR